MSHQDKGHCQVRYNAEYLKQALHWLLCHVDWSSIRLRDDCSWSPLHLAATALVWAWSDEATLGERFTTARRLTNHLYQPQQEFATSWQAFIKLIVRWTDRLVTILQIALRRRMQDALAASWMIHGFVVFGVDGGRLDLPRTKSHEAVNSPAPPAARKRKPRRRRQTAAARKKAAVPRRWLTLLWHAGTGLPWAWRSGPSGSSERDHWMQMLGETPTSALLAGDAGFIGYEYLKAVIDSGRDVLVRVGANVRLLRKLGWTKESAGIVYLWPDHAALRLERPLVLRLVALQGGKHPIYLVTSVMNGRLSDAQVGEIYRRRWGIEVYFRHFKQTFERRKLRCHCAANARVELEWSLLALWCLTLYAQAQQAKHGIAPRELSVAAVLRAFRRLMRDYLHPAQRGSSLCALLRHAVRDPYPRANKSSRDYPRQKHPDTPAGKPDLRNADPHQIRLAHALRAT